MYVGILITFLFVDQGAGWTDSVESSRASSQLPQLQVSTFNDIQLQGVSKTAALIIKMELARQTAKNFLKWLFLKRWHNWTEDWNTNYINLYPNAKTFRHGRERGRSKFASAMFLVSRCRQLHDLLNQHNIDFSQ